MADEPRPSLSEGRRRQKASIPESSARWRKEVVMFKGWLYANAPALLELAEEMIEVGDSDFVAKCSCTACRVGRAVNMRFCP